VKEELKEFLANRQKRNIDEASRVPSAVLIPLYKQQGYYHIIFIKRTEMVKEHKGQISFPGGVCEKEDKTLLDTALRECREEIGLRAEDVEVLGELDDEKTTTSNYIVSPFVATIPWPYHFRLNKYEVDEILEIPIRVLLDESRLKPNTEILDGRLVDSYAYHYQGRVIWGATARILNRFLEIYTRVVTG
jgi:8-oxo-dGTP pyrophosphatase MutT (NUDIX family)